jgi:hypothetical protein
LFCNGEWKRIIIGNKGKLLESDRSIEVCDKYALLMSGPEPLPEMFYRPTSNRVSKMENVYYKIGLYFSLD